MERTELRRLLLGSGCAEEHGGFLFLCDPHWSASERAEAEARMRQAETLPAGPDEGWLCIRTGGTGGGLKFARHDEHTLNVAVDGFRRHFGLERISAVGVLPPWHVSGLMAWIRCQATGGVYRAADWKSLAGGVLPSIASSEVWVISLVPTQLQRLLAAEDATRWLRRFRIVFLGGGPVWPELTAVASSKGVPVALSYGMTETAAMITAQRPEEFSAGDRSVGRVMPHGRIDIDGDGRVCVRSESLFRGYFPDRREAAEFVTDDLGRIDERGGVHILGRRDNVIITGGKKVQPAEIEAVLRASGEFVDVAVLGVRDAEWGTAVVACYPSAQRPPNISRATVGLAPYQRPKRYVAISDWPRNAQGKINRAALAALVEKSMAAPA